MMKSKPLSSFRIFPIFIVAIFFAINPSINAQEQSAYMHHGSIGQNKTVLESTEASKTPFPFRPISAWAGERFIFLPRVKSGQHFGYQSFFNDTSRCDYDKHVGRIAKVVSVIEKEGHVPKVIFSMEDNGETLQANAFTESIEDIGLVADIDSARARWLNKTLWYKKGKLDVYDEAKDSLSEIKIKKYSPVKIIDIVAGWYNGAPIRFILQSNTGEEGYADCNLSSTNVSNILKGFYHFDEFFMTEDPRLKYHWPPRVWSAIETGSVTIGMTPEQAKMSWGEPDEINRTTVHNAIHEQWVYKTSSYLYFENGRLMSIQN